MVHMDVVHVLRFMCWVGGGVNGGSGVVRVLGGGVNGGSGVVHVGLMVGLVWFMCWEGG